MVHQNTSLQKTNDRVSLVLHVLPRMPVGVLGKCERESNDLKISKLIYFVTPSVTSHDVDKRTFNP